MSKTPIPDFSSPRVEEATLLQAFKKPLPRLSPSFSMRVRLWFASFCWTLLALLYLGLLVFACLGPVVARDWLMSSIGSENSWLVAPLSLLGLLLAFAMLRPLLWSFPEAPPKLRRTPLQEPLLFALLSHLTRQMGTPLPTHVEFNNDTNISTRLDVHFWPHPHTSLHLELGLPLVANLGASELVAVLAHEFGHFTHKSTIFCYAWIQTLQGLFARGWEATLRWQQSIYTQGGWEASLSGPIARCSNGLFRGFLAIGKVANGFATRQMERDADRFSAQLLGTEAFPKLLQSIREIELAAQMAYSDLELAWQEGRLSDSLPLFVAAKRKRLPQELRALLEAEMLSQPSSLWNSHPTDQERIALAQQHHQEPIFALDVPGSSLLDDFEHVSRLVTRQTYELLFEGEVDESKLVTNRTILEQQETTENDFEALSRWTQTLLLVHELPTFQREDWNSPPDQTLDEHRAQLVALRQTMKEQLPEARQAHHAMDEANNQLIEMEIVLQWIDLGLPVPSDYESFDADALYEQQEAHQDNYEAQRPTFFLFQNNARQRWLQTLQLLHHPDLIESWDAHPTVHQQALDMTQALQALRESHAALMELRLTHLRLTACIPHLEQEQNNEDFLQHLQEDQAQVHRKLIQLRSMLAMKPYPFNHNDRSMTIGMYAIPKVPSEDDLHHLLIISESALDKLFSLHFRILGRLSLLCESLQQELGLEPLPIAEETIQHFFELPSTATPSKEWVQTAIQEELQTTSNSDLLTEAPAPTTSEERSSPSSSPSETSETTERKE